MRPGRSHTEVADDDALMGPIMTIELRAALAALCTAAIAQVSTARLDGVVRDASGAAVANSQVAAVNNRTQVRSETQTGPAGGFLFLSLPPGSYTLTATARGFRMTTVHDLELNVGASVSQQLTLVVDGPDRQTVEVQAPAERVQTAGAQVTLVSKLRDIEILPQLARWPLMLALYSPGVQTEGGSALSARVNGTRLGATTTRLDGIDINQGIAPALGLAVAPLNPDSVEEFRIVTSGAKAEYGHGAGAQIEMLTRSGTNALHGSIFEYHRNTALNANNFFNNSARPGIPRPKFIQSVFGGSLGAPIRRDRTFIFANFQGRRTAEQNVVNRRVLTPEARAGVFRWRAPGSSEIRAFDIVRNDPRGKGIDPMVAANLKLLPDPNNYDIGDGLNTAGYRFNNPSTSTGLGRNDALTIKADHNLSNGHRLFLRWAEDHAAFPDAGVTYPGQLLGTQGGPTRNFSIGADLAISGRMVNELRAGYKFFEQQTRRPARLQGPMLLANSWTDPLLASFASTQSMPVWHIIDNLTAVRGAHILKTGLELRFTRQRTSTDSGIWPNVSFTSTAGNVPPPDIGPSGNFISGADRQTFLNLYNDLLGRIYQVSRTWYSNLETFQPAGAPRVRDYRFGDYNFFLQDDWKLHPRLVLNLGLRYEVAGSPHEVNGFQGTVDKVAAVQNGTPGADLAIRRSGSWYRTGRNNLAPRAGLAWALTGDGKTALHASWGIFYERPIGATTTFADAYTPGFTYTAQAFPNAQGTDARVSDGIPSPPRPDAPLLRPAANRSTTIVLFAPDLPAGYVQQYSVTLQRELLRATVVEAGYVGTRGVKLFMNLNLNQSRIYQDFLGAFRELQAFRTNGTPVPASNTLVRIFGSPAAAIAGVGGADTVAQGAVGAAADFIDRTWFARYAAAGVSDFYLRNWPQFQSVIVGSGDGRSYYDSFQLSFRRQAGALRFVANYTFSKSIDNISVDGGGFTSPLDNFNLRLNRARGDFDVPHVFNAAFMYGLPGGRRHGIARSLMDWDLGLLAVWQTGRTFSYNSGRATGPTTLSSLANYAGDRNIGQVIRKADGVYWLTAGEIAAFSYPDAGQVGTSGRNAFRGPRFFNADVCVMKKFRIAERHQVTFRAEAYNLLNNVNFAAPNANLSAPATFGKISTTLGNPRMLQMALRYEF